MKILFLTNSEQPQNGYAVVGANLVKGLRRESNILVDAYTSEERRRFLPGRKRLKSEYVERFGWLAVVYDLLTLLILSRGRKCDLIHCNVEHYAPVAMLLSRIWDIPYTVTAHGTYGVVLPKSMRLFRRAFRRAARIVCVSRYTASRIQEEGIEARTAVIHNGVDKTLFHPDPSVVKQNSLTFVGNMKSRKGFPFLLEALERVHESGMRFRLLVIGNIGNPSEEIMARVVGSPVDVVFTGPLSKEQLVRYYQQAKLNILPSKSERYYFEGFGLVHLESNACGTLTVGTTDSGNVEAISPGNGYLVDYGDVERLAEIILTTLAESDPTQLIPVEHNLRDWRQVANEYGELFRTVIGEHSAHHRRCLTSDLDRCD